MKYIAVLVIMVVAIAAFLAGSELNPRTVRIVEQPRQLLASSGDAMESEIYVPAVDENGEGVTANIKVSIKPSGTGQTLASIDNILFFVDTQDSIRTAKHVAQEITGFDLTMHDIIYTISADASVIEGPSAGAALAIATIAALQDLELNPEVMITGTVLEDSTIGKVGQITEKAIAARDNGASLILIPKGSGIFSETFTYERVRTCQLLREVEYCESSYEKKKTSDLGIDVIEVATISEALGYFVDES